MTEIWKDIKEYEGSYQVSNLGNVRNLNYRNTGKMRMLVPNKTRNGYLMVQIFLNGKVKKCTVHRLVATAFVRNPENKETVNHINEIKTDNRVDNLEWMTQKENNNHGTRNERLAAALRKVRCTSISQFSLQGEYIRDWDSINEVERERGYWSGNLVACCKGKVKTAHGFQWRYKGDTSLPISPIAKGTSRTVQQCDSTGNIIAVFMSVSEASETINIVQSTISRCCTGERKTAGGYKWRYAA